MGCARWCTPYVESLRRRVLDAIGVALALQRAFDGLETVIRHAHRAVGGDQYVVGRERLVEHVVMVQVRQRLGHLDRNVDQHRECDRMVRQRRVRETLGAQERVQGAPIDPLPHAREIRTVNARANERHQVGISNGPS